MLLLLLHAALLCSVITVGAQETVDIRLPPSPCPAVFSYEESATQIDRWFGVVLVMTDAPLAGLRLEITLDRPAELLGNWVGMVTTPDNLHYKVMNTGMMVSPGPPLPVRIFVKFPRNQQDIPYLKHIKLNGKTICPSQTETPVAQPSTSAPYTPPTPRPPARSTPSPQTRPPTTDIYRPTTRSTTTTTTTTTPRSYTKRPGSSRENCGHVKIQPRPLITHGEHTERGMWPWHAALYRTKGIDISYTCGGSLVSDRHVVTAAHCVTSQLYGEPVDAETLLVYLGKYQLNMWSEGGAQSKQVRRVHIHPDYNTTSYLADIAVLVLSSPVEFSNLVQPVCIWGSDNSDLREIEGREGVVVGWGYDENGRVTKNLMMARMPIVSQQKCIYSYRDFFSQFTNEMTFCAGYRNGTSACNGDSGGGLVLPEVQRDSSTAWFLRGLVSLSVAKKNQKICDSSHYIVFTDVAKYSDWVFELL